MKQDAKETKKKWIMPVIIGVALLAIVGIVLVSGFGEKNDNSPPRNKTEQKSTEKETETTPTEEEITRIKLYWNVERKEYLDPVSNLSVRKPEADGLYAVRFAVDGEQVQLKCADKRLLNSIDALDLMGLVFDADGLIVDIVAPEVVAKEVAKEYFVKSFDGTTLTLNSSMTMNGMGLDIAVTEKIGIYNMDAPGEVVGQKDECKPKDKVSVYADETGEIIYIFIIERS